MVYHDGKALVSERAEVWKEILLMNVKPWVIVTLVTVVLLVVVVACVGPGGGTSAPVDNTSARPIATIALTPVASGTGSIVATLAPIGTVVGTPRATSGTPTTGTGTPGAVGTSRP